MRHALAIALALAGCTTLPSKGPSQPEIAPLYACRAEVWRELQRTADTSTPEAWVKVTDAADAAPMVAACCLMPDDTFQFCPKELGLTDAPMAEIINRRNEERRKAALAAAQQQGQTPANPAAGAK